GPRARGRRRRRDRRAARRALPDPPAPRGADVLPAQGERLRPLAGRDAPPAADGHPGGAGLIVDHAPVQRSAPAGSGVVERIILRTSRSATGSLVTSNVPLASMSARIDRQRFCALALGLAHASGPPHPAPAAGPVLTQSGGRS